MNDLINLNELTFTGITLRHTEEGDAIFDLFFECDLPYVLNITISIADDPEVKQLCSLIIKTWDGRPFAEHLVEEVLSKPRHGVK